MLLTKASVAMLAAAPRLDRHINGQSNEPMTQIPLLVFCDDLAVL